MGWKFLDISRLRDIELFEGLSDRALGDILGLTTMVEVAGAEHIFDEGDPGDAMYFILDGQVRISKHIPGVGEEALAFLEEGAYFGEMISATQFHDIWGGFVKSLSFGLIIAWFCTFVGYTAEATTEGVSRATTQAVVVTSLTVLIVDYMLTSILL